MMPNAITRFAKLTLLICLLTMSLLLNKEAKLQVKMLIRQGYFERRRPQAEGTSLALLDGAAIGTGQPDCLYSAPPLRSNQSVRARVLFTAWLSCTCAFGTWQGL